MEYLRIAFRRKWFIIIPVFAGLIIGICSGLLLPKRYKANTKILVLEGKTDNPLFQEIAVSTTVGERIATIKESMLGWNSLVKLVKRLNLDQDIKNRQEFEQLILKIRNNTIIRLTGKNIIDLAYIGKDPQTTQSIVKTITEIFIERNVEIQNQETSDAINFIEEQLQVYRSKIKSAEIAELQEKLDTLLIDSTEEHPMVKKLRTQIESKKEELKKEDLEYIEDARLSKESTSPLVNEIRKTLDDLQSGTIKTGQFSSDKDKREGNLEDGMMKILIMDKVDDVMGRDVKVNEQIYNMLLQRLETAKITQRLQSSKEGTRYTILDPPLLPISPISPNKPLTAAMGLIAGLALGVGLVFMREFLDKSFLDVQDAKEYLGQPLLGAISSIISMDEYQDHRTRERWIAGILIIAGIMAVIISVFIANVIH